MFWILPSPTRISGGLAVAAIMALSVMVAGTLKVYTEDRVPGLTGVDRSDDVIQARQLLMDDIESEMMVIELGLEGRAPQLDDQKARADRISTLLTAFPHLFPPQTKPGVAADGSPINTTATLALCRISMPSMTSPKALRLPLMMPVKPAAQTSSGSTQKSCAPPVTGVMRNT
jgi:hypothetical protein